MSTITALIPTIPIRKHLLPRAVGSVYKQTYKATEVVIEPDPDATGGAATRNRALQKVNTEWVAFLDDDDTWFPNHLESLLEVALKENATVVWSKWGGINQQILKAMLKQLNQGYPNNLPITCLVNVAAIRETEGFGVFYEYTNTKPLKGPNGYNICGNDRVLWDRLYKNGAKFAFCDKITWTWHSNNIHTSGSPWKK